MACSVRFNAFVQRFMMMLSSLRSRLIASYLLIILVCLLLAGAILAVLLQPLQLRLTFLSLADRAIPTVFRVREMLKEGLTSEEIAVRLKEQAEEQEIRVLLLTPQGQVLADTEGDLVDREIKLPLRQARLGSKRPYLFGRFSSPGGERLFYVALPVGVFVEGLAQRPLLVALATSQRRSVVGEMTPGLLIAGSVALVISIVLAFIIARSMAKPLQRIALAAEEIARGNYDQELTITSPEEVHRLAVSFNTMARQVKAAQQAQRDFVANVSHELKTPLTSIQGFSRAILDGTARDEEARRRAAQIVSDEAERMARLVEDLLELAKIEAKQIVMARETVNLSELLKGCLEKFALQAEEGGIELKLDLADVPQISGDGDRLAQVFTNLMDNALKHTPAGGRVTVAAREVPSPPGRRGERPRPCVEVTVTDTGPGIPSDDLPRIFERFYQVDKSRARGRGGVGLGLAIAKEIVQAHGGHISAESVVGLGTRFTVTLPAT